MNASYIVRNPRTAWDRSLGSLAIELGRVGGESARCLWAATVGSIHWCSLPVVTPMANRRGGSTPEGP